jgi:hypothetical protein
MCRLKYVLNSKQHFSFFIFGSRLSEIQINCNQINEGLLYLCLHVEINFFGNFLLIIRVIRNINVVVSRPVTG